MKLAWSGPVCALVWVAVPSAAKDAVAPTPTEVWKSVRAEADHLPTEAARTQFLFERSCEQGRQRRADMDEATNAVSNVGLELFNAVDVGRPSQQAILRLTSSIFEMRQRAVALGYFVGLCDEYTQRLRSQRGQS